MATFQDTKGDNAVRHHNTVFHTVLKHLPWGEFERLVEVHGADQRQRGFTAKTQLVAMIYAQLSGAVSLREIAIGLSSHQTRLYHLGIGVVRRSSLADANAHRSSALFADLLAVVVKRAHRGLRRKLEGTTYLIDATSLALSGRSARWARFSAGVCGASENAVRIQVAVALISFLLLRLAQASQTAVTSPLAFARLIRANLMHKRDLRALLEPDQPVPINPNQLALL